MQTGVLSKTLGLIEFLDAPKLPPGRVCQLNEGQHVLGAVEAPAYWLGVLERQEASGLSISPRLAISDKAGAYASRH